MPPGNPVYNMTPVTPPGMMGMPYTVGGVVAGMTGGLQHPYVGPNQAIADAYQARLLNDPGYKQLLANTYGTLGYQLGNTVGGMGFIDSLAGMTGYSASQMRRDLAGYGAAFGRSMVGSMVMPMADQMLSNAGVTGGSFLNSLNAIYANRMTLMAPGTFLNPYDAAQQRASVGATSAMMNLVNGYVSQTDAAGDMLATTNAFMTQGFDRDRVASLAMRMAGAGMFSGSSGGFAAQLQKASGLDDIGKLNYARGDFKHLGADVDSPDSIVGFGTDQAEKISRFTKVFTHKMKAGIEAMGAMRDFIHEIDGLEDKLTALTGGEWLRSHGGAERARDAVNRLNAVSKMHNLDPREALQRISDSSYTLQAAAVGGAGNAELLRAFGFDGGGMFRIEAQTELLNSVEDAISARGIQGDPILAGRMRQQGVQAMARNMNTRAGLAAQTIAWARQNGILTNEKADAFVEELTSGDQALMGDSVNRMLTTVFGSSRRGRELLQDQMFVQRMRQDMDGDAGKYAMTAIIRGSEREFLNRERMTAAERRVAFSNEALAGAGMKTVQSAEGVGRIVDSVAATLEQTGGKEVAAAFREQYASRVENGAKPNAALQATLSAFKSSPATAQYVELVDLAVKRQTATNNEFEYVKAGEASGTAKAMADFMRRGGLITGKQSSEITKMIRDGRGAEALALANQYGATLSPNQRKLLEDVKDDAASRYKAAVNTINDNHVAEDIVARATQSGYGSDAVSKAWNAVTAAIRNYSVSGGDDDGRDMFLDALDKSGYAKIAGDERFAKLRDSVLGAKSPAELAEILKTHGRQASAVTQLASEQLKGYGYGYAMSGYFGGGIYSGSGGASLKARDNAITKIVNAMNDANVRYGGDRQTLAQDFIDWTHGDKSIMNVMKVYDNDGVLTKLFNDSGVEGAKAKWEGEKEKFGDASKGVDEILKTLSRHGGADANAADKVRALLGRAENLSETAFDAELQTVLENAAIDNGDKDKIRNLATLKRSMVEAGQDMDAKVAALAKNQEAIDAYTVVKGNKEYADKRRSARHKEALAYLGDVGSIVDKLTEAAPGTDLGALGEAYKATKEVVTNDEVAKRLGQDNWHQLKKSGISNERVAEARLNLLKEKYGAGDQAAIKVMDKYKVAARDDKAVKVKGELVIKSGRDQETGVLEGDFGGM